jgi:predicted phosphodiesterase
MNEFVDQSSSKKTAPRIDVKEQRKQEGAALTGEVFLKLCASILERGKKMPRTFSSLLPSFTAASINSHSENQSLDSKKSEEEIELGIVTEFMEKTHELQSNKQLSFVEDNEKIDICIDNSIDPLGTIDQAEVLIIADQHDNPSYLIDGIRARTFPGYSLQQRIEKQARKGLKGKTYGTEIDINPIPEYNRDIKTPDEDLITQGNVNHAVRTTFKEWLSREVSPELHQSAQTIEPNKGVSVPLIINLGDIVTDGAQLTDQLSTLTEFYDLAGESAKLIRVLGNHDQDSRIPETVSLMTELTGHNVFTQKVGNQMIVVIDTNIMNPEWITQFQKRATENEKKILERRIAIQEAALKRMEQHEGEVIIIGHEPGRISKDLASELKRSQVTTIIGGHTHVESHFSTTLKNRKNESILMHVLDSTTHQLNNSPVPPKAYRAKFGTVEGGKIISTLQQNIRNFMATFETIIMGNY